MLFSVVDYYAIVAVAIDWDIGYAAIPNSNGNIGYKYDSCLCKQEIFKLISEVFGIPSSNLSLLESQ